MNAQFNSTTTTTTTTSSHTVSCKFAMNCARPECTFAHPNPAAPATTRLNKAVKMCRTGKECVRTDCHFGHASPALFMQEYIKQCEAWKKDFYTYWETDKKMHRDTALAIYLRIQQVPINAHQYIAQCIETAEYLDEHNRDTIQMTACIETSDAVAVAAANAEIDDCVDDDDADDAADLDDNDPDADEELADEIAAAFAKEFGTSSVPESS